MIESISHLVFIPQSEFRIPHSADARGPRVSRLGAGLRLRRSVRSLRGDRATEGALGRRTPNGRGGSGNGQAVQRLRSGDADSAGGLETHSAGEAGAGSVF